MMKNVSIWIRAKNEAEGLRRTLLSIQKQSCQPKEVVVLDNASTDSTPVVAKQLGAKVCTIADGQFSYGRALNMALDITTGDIIVFLSAHCPPVDEDWLKQLLRPLETEPPADATFGRQIPDPGVNRLEEWMTYRTFPRYPNSLLRILGLQRVTFSNGNAALSRAILSRHQFREDLSFAEDIEWWKRVLNEGGRVEYCPQSAVYHSHQLDAEALDRRMFLVGQAMKQCGSGKVFATPVTGSMVFAGTIMIDLFYCIANGYWNEIPHIINYRRHFFRGLRRGLSEVHRQTDDRIEEA